MSEAEIVEFHRQYELFVEEFEALKRRHERLVTQRLDEFHDFYRDRERLLYRDVLALWKSLTVIIDELFKWFARERSDFEGLAADIIARHATPDATAEPGAREQEPLLSRFMIHPFQADPSGLAALIEGIRNTRQSSLRYGQNAQWQSFLGSLDDFTRALRLD